MTIYELDVERWTELGNTLTLSGYYEEMYPKAKEHVDTLDLPGVLEAEKRALESISQNFGLHPIIFKDPKNPRIMYTILPSEYLDFLHQRLEKLLLE